MARRRGGFRAGGSRLLGSPPPPPSWGRGASSQARGSVRRASLRAALASVGRSVGRTDGGAAGPGRGLKEEPGWEAEGRSREQPSRSRRRPGHLRARVLEAPATRRGTDDPRKEEGPPPEPPCRLPSAGVVARAWAAPPRPLLGPRRQLDGSRTEAERRTKGALGVSGVGGG